MRRASLLVTSLTVLWTTTLVVRADDTKKQEAFCASLSQFNSDLATLEAIGPSSTIAELRTAANRVDSSARQVQKKAGKIKTSTAKQFTASAKKLGNDARSLPDSMTLEQAQSKLKNDVQDVEQAAQQLATASGCPDAARPPQAAPRRGS